MQLGLGLYLGTILGRSGPFAGASLYLDMLSGSLDSRVTFSRGTNATLVDSTGRVTYAPANLLLRSQEFDNAAWTKNAATVTANTTPAPDGTGTADTLTATAGTGVIPRVADIAFVTVTSSAYTASMYVKAGTYTFFQIYLNNQAAEWANFTLTGAGTATANGASTATITALSNGWYRCSMTYTAGGIDRRPFFMLAASGTATRAQTWNPVGTETLFIWGAQLEPVTYQTTPGPYVATTSAAYYGPRFDYDPVTLAPRGLMIEQQRTNLFLQSQTFGVTWLPTRASVATVSSTAPSGAASVDKIVEDTSTNSHFISQTVNPVAGNASVALSIFAKPAGRNFLAFVTQDSEGTFKTSFFNVSNGTIGTVASGHTASIEAFPDGWYRCVIVTAQSAVSGVFRFYPGPANVNGSNIYAGDGSSGVLVWGAQLEAGAFATSYIPTVASQVTRTADQASIVAPNFAPWYNQSEGTFVVEWDGFKPTTASGTPTIFQAGNATDSFIDAVLAGGNYLARTFVGGVSQAEFSPAYVANATEKFATAYKINDFAFSRNGATALVDTSGNVPTNLDRIGIGITRTGTNVLNGHIRRITYYPVRLTNAQLQALTA
jgi:hypothetical protein